MDGNVDLAFLVNFDLSCQHYANGRVATTIWGRANRLACKPSRIMPEGRREGGAHGLRSETVKAGEMVESLRE